MYAVVAKPRRLLVVSVTDRKNSVDDHGILVELTVDRVEPLEESLAINEVETLTRVAAEVTDDEIDVARAAADVGIERTL